MTVTAGREARGARLAAEEARTEVERMPEMARMDPTVFMVKRIVGDEELQMFTLVVYEKAERECRIVGDEAAERGLR